MPAGVALLDVSTGTLAEYSTSAAGTVPATSTDSAYRSRLGVSRPVTATAMAADTQAPRLKVK
jgi:hypothetical protein